jgi:mRNA interferase MazF
MAQHRATRGQGWPRRGEIYLTALDPTLGHEIKKTRPALVVQNDVGNEFSATTIVAPISSTVRLPLSPVHVLLSAGADTGLSSTSITLLNQIRTVDHQRLIKRLGAVDAGTMELIDEAIAISLGLKF